MAKGNDARLGVDGGGDGTACLAAETARAADAQERVSLRWNAPDACPDDAEWD